MSDERIEVRRFSPARRRRLRFLIALAVVAALAVSFHLGRRSAVDGLDGLLRRKSALEDKLLDSNRRSLDLEQQLANLERGAAVDQQVIEEVRRVMHASQERIEDLEEEISFYKGLMDPGSAARGLDIRSFEVLGAEAPGVYDFKLVLQQVAKQHNVIQGYATIALQGYREGQEVEVSLHELSEDLEKERIALRFRYFQTVAGSLMLPQGFVPRKVHVLAKSTGRKPQQVEKVLDWVVMRSQ